LKLTPLIKTHIGLQLKEKLGQNIHQGQAAALFNIGEGRFAVLKRCGTGFLLILKTINYAYRKQILTLIRVKMR
jgi:hypothetical protein